MPALPEDIHIAVVGLGYVGLPLAVEFGKILPTTGYDVSTERIAELRGGADHTLEISAEELTEATRLRFSDQLEELVEANVYIVTVPTPIDAHKQPDLSPLISASRAIGSVLRAGNVVIYESTVYPGATEEVCIPILEEVSGLTFNRDFSVGYSPERINPGDKEHRVSSIIKVTSGSNPAAAAFIDSLYGRIIKAGTHCASSIKVAEAAKVIENTQRDLNIALINELAIIFGRLGIDTMEVLEAAGTKWNFLKFQPGLVGGHCISVDPYYLTYKAQEIGYHPQVILSGRQINDGMGGYIAEQVVKMMTQRKIHVVDSQVLVLGFAFKENCPDLRNTRVIDIVRDLQEYHANVHVYDPWVDPAAARHEYGLELIEELQHHQYDAIIVAVGHDQFAKMSTDSIHALGKDPHILYDIKSLLPKDAVDRRL